CTLTPRPSHTAPRSPHRRAVRIPRSCTRPVPLCPLRVSTAAATRGSGTRRSSALTADFTTLTMTTFLTTDATTSILGGTLTIPSGQKLTLVRSALSSNVGNNGTLIAQRTNSITRTYTSGASPTPRALGSGGAPARD